MAGKASAAIVGLILAATVVAFAAGAPRRGEQSPASRPVPAGALQSPRITGRPDSLETATIARFRFADVRGARGYQCRIDDAAWRACRSPLAYRDLDLGKHAFAVRALMGRRSRSAARTVSWRILESKGFGIAPRFSALPPLYPGAAPVELPLRLENPNPIPLLVTAIGVGVSRDPVGCDSATNLVLTGSSASAARPVTIPARGSVGLPAPGASAPTIQLRDLPLNQDACQNAQFPLTFSGSAHG